MAKKKKKGPAGKATRKKPGRKPGLASSPESLPVVRPINFNELRLAEREQERQQIRTQGVSERSTYFLAQMEDLVYSMQFMDRVFMRNAIYRIQLGVEEHAAAMQLTAAERREWTRLASAALKDTDARQVPDHCRRLVSFWQNYLRPQ